MKKGSNFLVFLGVFVLGSCSDSGLEGFTDTFQASDEVENSEFTQSTDAVEGDFFLTVISEGVSSGEVVLNDVELAKESDFHNDSFERTTEVSLEDENTIQVEVRGQPGDQLCVRIFEVLPPAEVEEDENDERTIYERCVDREAGPPNSVDVTFEPDDTL